MLEVILDRRLLFVLMGVIAAVGIISKAVVSISLKSLTKAAGNMGKSSHALMRLVRAKYEHACMVSDKVQNVEAFIEKYIYEYKVLGIRLHGWRRMERACAWGCLAAGLLAAGGEYALRGMNDQVLRSAAAGAVAGILLFLLRISMDENYRLTVIRTYMVDYLENVCARRFEKNREANVSERQRQPEELPVPRDEPEVLPPVTQEPYRTPETGMQPEGMKAADRVRAAKERDRAEQNGMQIAEERAFAAEALAEMGTEEPRLVEAEESKYPATKEKKTSRAAKRKEQLAERASEKSFEPQEEKLRSAPSREVLIREILEEFLA